MITMSPPRGRKNKGEKVRVPFRRNRSPRQRNNDWTDKDREGDAKELDAIRGERVVPKGDISRQRTIIVGGDARSDLIRGVVVAVRGLYADVDDGSRVVGCTVRRILRTRIIHERNPVTVGDRVGFVVDGPGSGQTPEGVIESIEPRRGVLQRLAGRRVQTIVVNVDQAIIVSSAGQPDPKPHLIDRYMVSAHAGEIAPVICMNKIDLDVDGFAVGLLDRYERLGYRTVRTSAATGEGIEALREMLRDRISVIAGQSGVGKSSLLNALQPGLELRVGAVHAQTEKGKHTTTTACMHRLAFGGYVVDTPGIRSFDLSVIPAGELEAYFAEFVPLVPKCKFPDCTHTHETECAVVSAVESGEIHPDRYATYLGLFQEASRR